MTPLAHAIAEAARQQFHFMLVPTAVGAAVFLALVVVAICCVSKTIVGPAAGLLGAATAAIGLVVLGGAVDLNNHYQTISDADRIERLVLDGFAHRGYVVETISPARAQGAKDKCVKVRLRAIAGEVGGRQVLGDPTEKTVPLDALKAAVESQGLAFDPQFDNALARK